MSRTRHIAALLVAALAGIALAAAITLATSQLVRQHIGLASEPLGAGSKLLPASVGAAPTGPPHRPPSGRSDAGVTRRSIGPAVVPTPAGEASSAPPPPVTEAPRRASPQPSSGGTGESGDASARRDD